MSCVFGFKTVRTEWAAKTGKQGALTVLTVRAGGLDRARTASVFRLCHAVSLSWSRTGPV